MIAVIAELAVRRLVRGRALWVAGVIALLPVMFAVAMRRHAVTAFDLLTFQLLVVAVLPAMLVSAAIGEDIEDRTITYVWSRPVPRWAMPIGKLAALAPISVVLVAASWSAAWALGFTTAPPLRSVLAVALGAATVSVVAAGLAMLVPRHGMALAICYVLFFDLPVGVLPASIQQLSATRHVRAVADIGGRDPSTLAGALIGLGAIAAVWLAIVLWRTRRLEA